MGQRFLDVHGGFEFDALVRIARPLPLALRLRQHLPEHPGLAQVRIVRACKAETVKQYLCRLDAAHDPVGQFPKPHFVLLAQQRLGKGGHENKSPRGVDNVREVW